MFCGGLWDEQSCQLAMATVANTSKGKRAELPTFLNMGKKNVIGHKEEKVNLLT